MDKLIVGTIFCLCGLAFGILIPMLHPDARASAGQSILAILIGVVFLLGGLLMLLEGNARYKRIRAFAARSLLVVFASVFLLAPLVAPHGEKEDKINLIGIGILGGIMALLILVCAVWKWPKATRKQTGPPDDTASAHRSDKSSCPESHRNLFQ